MVSNHFTGRCYLEDTGGHHVEVQLEEIQLHQGKLFSDRIFHTLLFFSSYRSTQRKVHVQDVCRQMDSIADIMIDECDP